MIDRTATGAATLVVIGECVCGGRKARNAVTRLTKGKGRHIADLSVCCLRVSAKIIQIVNWI